MAQIHARIGALHSIDRMQSYLLSDRSPRSASDAKHQQHRHVPVGFGAEGRSEGREGGPEEALRESVEGLRGQVRENREGEEAAREGGRSDSYGGHARRDRRRDGEGETVVSVADVRGG